MGIPHITSDDTYRRSVKSTRIPPDRHITDAEENRPTTKST